MSKSILGTFFARLTSREPPFCVECGSTDMELVDKVLVCKLCANRQANAAADRRILPELDTFSGH
ncbi:MAG TPA: hypothetical protein VMH91_03180 [Candidatus Paceibacterota bacterium]|nr:hypothetical protein [Candidatus Paceibacterota bacterium]